MTAFVLIHGGYGGAWNWELVEPLLDAPALAVDLPGRGGGGGASIDFGQCAEAVLASIDEQGFDRVIAVGHSMGGLTISALAKLAADRVAHLVYLAALAPAPRTCVFDIYYGPERAGAPLHPDGIVPLGTAAMVRGRLFDDLDDKLFDSVYPRMVAEPASLFTAPPTLPPESIPRTYIRCARDIPVPPRMATGFIAQLGQSTDVVDLDVGHGLIYTHPGLVAEVLNGVLAGATGS